eukprot:gene20681-22720_t
MKTSADRTNHAKKSDVSVGDTVLVKERKINKFSTRFNPTLYQMLRKKGSMLTAKSIHRQYITRNISFFKRVKFDFDLELSHDDDDDINQPNIDDIECVEGPRYPQRERRQVPRLGHNIYDQ